MKPIFYVYTEDYHTARRLANTLYRPAIDKIDICTQEVWAIEENGYIEVERDTEIWRIFQR